MNGDNGQQRSGIPAQLILGVIIAVIGLISYFGKTQVNPVTGEVQRVALSVDQERSLGLKSAPGMAQKMGGALNPRTDARARIVAEVGNKLVRAGSAGKSPYADNFHFYLLADNKTVNAFALPGGQIFVTLALYQRMNDEAELAGVLGHEIGHVIHRHSAQQMAKGELGQLLTVATGIAADDGSGRGRGNQAAMSAAMVNQMVQLKYGRNDESQSDSYGLKAMDAAGYDPNAMLDVMKILKEASGAGGPPEFLSSHPLPQTRLNEIAAYLKNTYPNGIPIALKRGAPLPKRAAG